VYQEEDFIHSPLIFHSVKDYASAGQQKGSFTGKPASRNHLWFINRSCGLIKGNKRIMHTPLFMTVARQ
jgi:hypothetical protein